MKKEELFLAVGKIEDQMIERGEQEETWNRKKGKGGYKKVLVAAICVIVISSGIVTWSLNRGTEVTIQFTLSESGEIAGEIVSVESFEWKDEAVTSLKAKENVYKVETAEITNEEIEDVLLKLGIKEHDVREENGVITYSGEEGSELTYYKESATLAYYNGKASTEESTVQCSEEKYKNLVSEWLQKVDLIEYSSLEFAGISPREWCIMEDEIEQVISYSIVYRIKGDKNLAYEGTHPGVEVVISSSGEILSAEFNRRKRTDHVISCKLKGKKEIEKAIKKKEHVEIVGEAYEVDTLELTSCNIEYFWEGKNDKQEYLLPYYVLEGIEEASGSNVVITMPAVKECYLSYQN